MHASVVVAVILSVAFSTCASDEMTDCFADAMTVPFKGAWMKSPEGEKCFQTFTSEVNAIKGSKSDGPRKFVFYDEFVRNPVANLLRCVPQLKSDSQFYEVIGIVERKNYAYAECKKKFE